MPTQLQLRGGTTAQHTTFTGLVREVTVDTTKDTLVVHDGSTVGGHELARADLSNVTLPTSTTYSISAETATGGVNIRLTGSNATTDDVKLAAGTNVTLTRTDASTITIAATGGGGGATNLDGLTDVVITSPANGEVLKYNGTNWVNGADLGGGGGGSGTVNSGIANALAYYPSAGTTVDDLAAITWNSGTTTLSVTGTVSATDFVSTGAGTPNFSSDTDLEIITNATVSPKSFTFGLDGTFTVGNGVTGTPAAKSFEIEGGIEDRFFRAESNMSAYSNTTTAVVDLLSYRSSPASGQRGAGIDFRQSSLGSSGLVASSIYTTLTDASSGTEDTTLTIQARKNGAMQSSLVIDGDGITVPNTITFTQDGSVLFQGTGTNQVTALGKLELGAGATGIELISVGGAVTLSPTTQVTVDGDMVINSGYQLKFNTAPFRIVAAPTTSVGATGDKAGDVAMNGTSIFYCTAAYDGTTNIWVKSAWTTTGTW